MSADSTIRIFVVGGKNKPEFYLNRKLYIQQYVLYFFPEVIPRSPLLLLPKHRRVFVQAVEKYGYLSRARDDSGTELVDKGRFLPKSGHMHQEIQTALFYHTHLLHGGSCNKNTFANMKKMCHENNRMIARQKKKQIVPVNMPTVTMTFETFILLIPIIFSSNLEQGLLPFSLKCFRSGVPTGRLKM
ncbi:hypothetical protein KUTeg_022168 [Tegillarca granosa]|uniref:Uncharacterized protein n=1 Tax=Tegillarca granosa TaxID=220873 RepID=A0ABQ9E5G1_TEGGR|nr:hypothetical protein KUTeg_022168 [Tegillarca granosa]